jgi:hypothetical protein
MQDQITITDPTSLVEEMFKGAPAALSRAEVARRSGGAVSEKTLANLDSLGRGIPNRFRLGSKVMYETKSTIEWLKSRVASVSTEPEEVA